MNIQASLNSMLGDVSRLAFSKEILGAAKTSKKAGEETEKAAKAQKQTEEIKQSIFQKGNVSPEDINMVETEIENYIKEHPEKFAGPNQALLHKTIGGDYVARAGQKRAKVEAETINRLREKTDNKKNQSTALKERFEYFTDEGPQVWEV